MAPLGTILLEREEKGSEVWGWRDGREGGGSREEVRWGGRMEERE